MIKVIKTTCNVVRNVVFALAVVVLICAVLCMVLQIKPGIVISGSMEPEIGVGSVIFIDKKDKDIEVGDIIAFERGGAMVTHRVVDITEQGYVTKGDNNESVDASQVVESELVGTTFFSIPKIGYALRWMSTKTGMIVVATICICIILLGFITPQDTSEKKKKGKKEDLETEDGC